MLRLWEGIVRRALSEPSIGSITTRASPPAPKATSPRSSETATKEAPSRGQRLELGEDDVLAAAVDHQGVVAALADALVDGALLAARAPRRRSPAARRRRGGRFPASLRRKRPSAGCYGALALGDARRARRPRRRRTSASARSPTATGPLLLLGAAGTGKTEVLARRLARLAAERHRRPSGCWSSPPPGPPRGGCANASRRCSRAPSRSSGSAPGTTIGERLLREHAEAAGLDPFFDVLGPAERLAMLLDRLDELPLRRHEIRGNPAGLLARLLERIDALKAERVGPTTLESAPASAEAATRRGRARGGPARARVRRALRRPRPDPRRGRQPRPRRRLPRPRLPAAPSAPTCARADRRALRAPDGRRARGDDRGPAGDPRGARAPTTRTSSTPSTATRAPRALARLVPRPPPRTAT